MDVQGELRILTINKDSFQPCVLYRLQKGWTLHFELGHSLADKEVHLFVNHPLTARDGWERTKYRKLSWKSYSEHCIDMFDKYASVPLILAGSFNYYFTIGESPNQRGCGTFLVDPVLRIGKMDEKLSLEGVTCQTVLTKSLGKLKDWSDRLSVARECGYNMIHFTPIQELGASMSSYCLSDQHALNPSFDESFDKHTTMAEVQELVNRMQTDWGVLSLTDLVFNHTANESSWIRKHPESVYNVVNSPHLKPSYVLDRAIYHFNQEISLGKWANKGIPANLCTEDHLKALHWHFQNSVLPPLKIEDYYLLNIDDVVQQFTSAMLSGEKGVEQQQGLTIINDPKFRRLKSTTDIQGALYFFNRPKEGLSEADRQQECIKDLRKHLDYMNNQKRQEISNHLNAAVTNVVANARYRFVDEYGLRIKKVTEKEPIMFHYFMPRPEVYSLAKEEEMMHTDKWGNFCMVHNGWVMGDDPLRNFAEPGSNVYLRRELIPWGDSVKLRYGSCPADSPYLWEHMRQYTINTAKVFHGIRLDNCHSTPIHVAEYMLDEARKVRPDLYIIAELFTSSESKDNLFVNRLGLTALIREGLNAKDSHELGRLVHRFGGLPVGAFIQPKARHLIPSVANAIFLDQTHDNPSPVEKRSVYDLLPSTALISMACCASGSNRGYDELVPHHINVVTEERLYRSWSNESNIDVGLIDLKTGITAAKKAINKLHTQLSHQGFNQIYVDQVDHDIISVTRHNPVSHQSVILVARTAFTHPKGNHIGNLTPLYVPGDIEEIIYEGRLITKKNGSITQTYKADKSYINGISGYSLVMQEHVKISDSVLVSLDENSGVDGVQRVQFNNFPHGSVIAFRVNLKPPIKTAVLRLRGHLSQFGFRMHTYSGRNLEQMKNNELETIVTALSLNDINRVLFRCDAEEKDDGNGGGAYVIDGHGPLNFCGLHGVLSLLNTLRPVNNLGHQLCDNLRNGDWMLTYISKRLQHYSSTKPLATWFESVFNDMSCIPRYLIPCYFDAIVRGVYQIVEEVACAKMSPFIQTGPSVVRRLAMGSTMFCSFVPSGRLPELAPSLAKPKPANCSIKNNSMQITATLCAGLPHFAAGIWRNWGRDTFIALPGLLLVTGRFSDARFLILGYAATLRHGLIPNLLGDGVAARYNCRDAVWFWLQSIKEYCTNAPDGYKLLEDSVSRIYPTDDSEAKKPGDSTQPLYDVIQEALQTHAQKLSFRERNAGYQIDREMSDEGFNNVIGVDWDTGFVYGGNVHNCGTWMDKMGSSQEAGNKGVPATPRDGSAVELVGLCKSVVMWLAKVNKMGHYPYEGVTAHVNGVEKLVKYSDWADLIQKNFHPYFWIGDQPNPLERRPDLINRHRIYKDCCGATQQWTDYQLRCNFPVAMVVAPELFADHPDCAMQALDMADKYLMGPLGMKTLDPSDYNYNGDYNNDDNSCNYKTARGFNYHQGPEWVWPVGYYLRARLQIASMLVNKIPDAIEKAEAYIHQTLCHHNSYLQTSDWDSLPELTNANGKICNNSCTAQAWSVGCILEVLNDLKNIRN